MVLVQYPVWTKLRESVSRGEILRGTALKPTLFALGALASALMLGLAGFGLGWLLSGWRIADLKDGQGSPSAMSITTTKRDAALPKADVPGEDFSDLPRYPDSIRVEYERYASEAGLVLIETEYAASADSDDVREFYRGVFQSEGWTVAGLNVSEGEWDFFATKGEREAIVEIEPLGGSLEIEIEVSEPQTDKMDGEARDEHTNGHAILPRRPEEFAPQDAPSSDEDYDFGDDYDDGFDENFEDD